MKSFFAYSLMLLLFCPFVKGQNLSHWIEIGLENSPTTKAQQAKIKAAEQLQETVFEWGETQIQVSAIEWMPNDWSPYFRPTFSVSQEIPWFGTEKSKKKIAASELRKEKSAAKNIQAELVRNIRVQYIELQYFREQYKLLKNHQNNLESIYENLLIKLESGQTAAWEVILLENEINSIEAELRKSAFRFKKQKEAFELIIGQPIDDLVLDSLEMNVSENLKEIKAHPILDQLASQKEELNASKEALKIDYAPKLNVGIHYEAAMPVEPTYVTHDMLMPTIGVSFPLFSNQRKAKEKLIDFQQESLSAEIENQKNLLQQEWMKVQDDLFSYQTDWEFYGKNLKNMQDAIQLLWREYEANKISFQEITRTEERAIEFSLNRLESLKNYNQAQAYLLYLLTNAQ